VAEAEYGEAGPVQLAPGDILFVGTDGIWETRNPEGELYGKNRLRDAIQGRAAGTADEILEAVFQSVAQFRGTVVQADDITALICKATAQEA
jgi:sigma-B regulation protein RsbU (phosphoserine phosphatase)